MPFATLSTGATLYYDDSGTGTPILLIHGLLGTAQLHFPKLTEWLSVNYRVIGPTLRGYGQSTPKPRDFPVDFYHRDADDILAFMDALNLPKAHIMGYSDGGEIAIIAAGKQPDRFKSVVSWGAVGYFGPAMRPVAQRMYPGDWITDEEVALHGIDSRERFVLGWIHAVKTMIDAGGDVSLSLAKNITCPLLLLLGEEDTLNPEEYGRNLVNQTAKGRLVMFPGGHAVHDIVWDQFKQVVGEFLEDITDSE
ncbi:MAG: alpha/beta hydrolase [Anaerolineae bacterium]|jgi:valacyclovir hydrolase|nr:alpha/beta hydrolase [Anaerolineae bacterium]